MTGVHNAGYAGYARMTGRAATAALAAVVCVSAAWANGQRASAHASAPRSQPTLNQPARPQYQNRPAGQSQGRQQGNAGQRPGPGYPAPRPAYPGSPYLGPGYPRPGVPGYGSPMVAPPGHLGDWLNQHRGLPVQEQERMLRGDPSFRRLNPADQQRLMQQLHQVNQMPEEQRQRRLARAEMIEHLSPQERMQINLSARRWAFLPPVRQALMKNAFQDLRAVPLDQRQMVLNSGRYRGVFSPEERGILTDMLRVEPYEPAR